MSNGVASFYHWEDLKLDLHYILDAWTSVIRFLKKENKTPGQLIGTHKITNLPIDMNINVANCVGR